MKKTKSALLHSVIALLLCISMFISSTFAWFTDTVSSGKNVITAGNLDLEMYWTDDLSSGQWYNVEENGHNTIFSYENWEPGYTDVKYIKLVNAGDLALNYELTLTPQNGVGKLAEVINVYFAEGGVAVQQRSDLQNLKAIGLLSNVLNGGATAGGTLLAADQLSPLHPSGEVVMTVAMNMLTTAGNDYQNEDAGEFTVTALATQAPYEADSFGNDYDAKAELPGILTGGSATGAVTPVDGKVPAGGVSLTGGSISAYVPEGVVLEDGVNELTLTVTPMENTTSDITVVNNEILIPVDVHIQGVAATNNVPMVIDLGEVLPKYLNMGNYRLFHVENGANQEMTLVSDRANLTAHNQFTYDPLTGAVSVAMATFSEVALIADTDNGWNGNFDDSWYNAGADELTIANADQFVAFGAIVGGMQFKVNNEIKQYKDKEDSFKGQTIKLISDINLADNYDANNENVILYPVGYYNTEYTYGKTGTDIDSGFKTFEGTFDGNGHTISNIYQNTWEMKGDHEWYAPEDQHYRDGMGLFGKVYGGTVKNLTVKNFKSDGEITTSGTIAAYADCGATFENIAIFNCNPRVYNIGNGGIVGCVGWYANDAHTTPVTFKNITVDNSNKISALWGSWDVACGGIVGQYYPTSGQENAIDNGGIYLENCHVAAQMDVYNDVCANYQYYAYRYAGILIGSVRENVEQNGHVYPNMDGISAKDCTVHFGDWNDYYYCELVANSLASYTHDHQMSRLEQVKAINGTTITYLDGTTGTVPTSGRYNYVEVKAKDDSGKWIHGDGADYATCYHFVDGAVWNHADAGTETVNGQTVLKEDKQLVYREFNNLVTGYGWGVTSKGVGEMNGVTILDREVANSVPKFTSEVTELANNKAYKLGDIFTFVDNGVKLVPDALTVAVTNLDENNPVSAEFVRDSENENWENGTITFTGTGEVQLTIQDYYFCTPTIIEVKITDRQSAEKFEVAFDHDSTEEGKQNNIGKYLYRVGNQNTVALGSLFAAVNEVSIGSEVKVSVETVAGNASGTYTADATWTNGTIQFSGTGVVKVTITDNDFCTPTELIVEVVDATNITSATGTTSGGNFVLLCDVNTSTYVNYWDCTLYGNGFTYSLKGAPTAYNSKQGHGILITKNATLDNLVIVGDVYNSYGAYTTQDYYNAAVDVVGDTTIQNCYISGCAAPVSTRANATITNTTLYGGTVANLIIKSGTVMLEDVTTANYDDGRSLVGMGIVIHSDATESAKLVLNGTLTQYNFISESKVPTDTYAKNLHTTMFGDSCSKYHFGSSPNRSVNAGIVSLTALFNAEDITDNANTGYVGTAVTVSGVNGYVYTQPNTSGSVDNSYTKEDYSSTTQGTVPPTVSFDHTINAVAKADGSNDYCYEENGVVNISMDKGDTFNWDTSILTATKYGQTLDYTVMMNGTDYTGKSIAFNTADDYEVVYTYTDDHNSKLDENGNIITYSVDYKKTVKITVAVVEAATKHAEFTFGSSNTASTTVTVGNSTYVMPNVSATSSTIGSTTVSGQTIYYPIVEIVMSDNTENHSRAWYAYFPVFSGAVTITDYKDNGLGDADTFGSNTTSMPSGLSIVGDPAQLFKYQSSSTAGTTPVVKNNILVYSSPSISAKRSEYNTVIQYSYQDNAGATYYYYIGYYAPAQSYTSCVTPDTLVTLADGTQKRIDQVTYADQLLVWDFDKGEYSVASSSIIENHGYDNNEIIKLTFADGTVIKVVNAHGFFDADQNKWVDITAKNAQSYVGHNFTQVDGASYKTVKLISAEVTTEYVEAWSILTVDHYNCIMEGMFSITPPATEQLAFFEIGEGMKYDAKAKRADIEKYGLFVYDEFAHLMTEEQFDAFNMAEIKIAIGKGLITYEEVLALLASYA